jgi:hypothetical protein
MNLMEKFSKVVRAIEKERGRFVLFGLFARADTPSVVDVVVSAGWINGQARMAGIRYVVKKIGEVLKPEEMLNLSRIVPMDTTDSEIRNFVAQIGTVEVMRSIEHDFVFAQATILSARIFSSHPVPDKSRKKAGRVGGEGRTGTGLVATTG